MDIEWLQEAPETLPQGARLVKLSELDSHGFHAESHAEYAVITDHTVTLDDILVQYRDDVWTDETPYSVEDLHAEWAVLP